ncbi:MAG: DUF4139 domain-containing protein [Candidatus Omnitrophica bacterium]|jgi:hypothetical protein|nr:DUF4139 domain-containing protein [Candidatus Omnitrophota bacterium]
MKNLVIFVFGFLFCFSVCAQENVELTVYNQNFALVKDQRSLDLKKGLNKVDFKDVASLIEPTSVHFVSLTAPDSCSILEQNYEYDLMSSEKLLSKYIDKNIKIITKDAKTYEGVLSSFDANNIIISGQDGLSMIVRPDNIAQISFDKTPEGLITKPTLVWEIENGKEGKHLTEVSYLTGGVNWLAEYVTVLDRDDKKVSLDGWVSITNNSGVGYKNAKLKLIAGDVKRVQPQAGAVIYNKMALREKDEAMPQFQEKAFFEYHMYTLQRKATLKNNQIKQISLLSANNIPVKKVFIYDPVDYYGWNWYRYDNNQTTKEQKIKVKIELTNSKQNNLGMPLPKGKVKVYKKDDDGSLQFIGEDQIDHTPKDETIKLYLGDAFDVVGERKKMNYRTGNDWAEESFEITLRNHKESDIEVNVIEHMWRYSNWKIINKSHEFTKKDAQTIEFKVPVVKDGEAKVTYTVRYWW